MSTTKTHFGLATCVLAVCSLGGLAGAQDGGLIFEDSVLVENSNGLYTAWKNVRVCFDPECDTDCCENGKIVSLTMRYTGDDCTATSHTQDPDKVDCDDFGVLPDTVYIIASKDDDCGGDIFFEGTVNLNETYVIDAENGAAPAGGGLSGPGSKLVQPPLEGKDRLRRPQPLVALGDTLPSTTYICIFDMQGGELLQQVKFHTSCSQPLFVGDQFGANAVVSCVGEDEADADEDCCDAAGKPIVLTMEYTGAECDTDANSQPSGKFECAQDVPGRLPDTVYVIASKDSDCDGDVYFEGTVSIGDEFVIDSNVVGGFGSNTYLCFYDVQGGTLLQHVQFHTSCSAPINVGDGFGAAKLIAYEGEDGTCEAPVPPCDPFPEDGLFTYVYEICNHDTSAIGLIAFEILVDSGDVVTAGWLDGDGVVPSNTTISSNRVEWDFFNEVIMPGECSRLLYITSPLGPDLVGASISGMAALDTPTMCAGPAVECDRCSSGSVCFSCPSGLAEGNPCAEDCCTDAAGKPRIVEIQYTGNDCDSSSNSQEDGKWSCSQDVPGQLPNTVYVVASDDSDCDGDVYFEGTVSVNDTFVIDADVLGMDRLSSNTYMCFYDVQGGTLLQHVKFHTSCSTPLFTQDSFGAGTVVNCVGENE